MCRAALRLASVLLWACCTAHAQGVVNLNNLGYARVLEIGVDGVKKPIKIAYKSRTLFQGLFGFGWCSELESTLVVELDGTLTLKHCGDGRQVSLHGTKPVTWDRSMVSEAVARRGAGKTFQGEKPLGQVGLDKPDAVSALLDQGVPPTRLLEAVGLGRPNPGAGRYVAGRASASFDGKDFQVIDVDGTRLRFDARGQMSDFLRSDGLRLRVLARLKNELEVEVDGIATRLRLGPSGQVTSIQLGNRSIASFSYEEPHEGFKALVSIRLPSTRWRFAYSKFMNLESIWRDERIHERMSYDDPRDWTITHEVASEGCSRRYEAGDALAIEHSPLKSMLTELRAASSLPEAQTLYSVSVFERCGTANEALVSAQAFAHSVDAISGPYQAAVATWTRAGGVSFAQFDRNGDLLRVKQPPVPVNSTVDRSRGTFSSVLMSVQYREPLQCERDVEAEGVLAQTGSRPAQAFRLRMGRAEILGNCLVVRMDWSSESGTVRFDVRRSSEGRSVALTVDGDQSLTLGATGAPSSCGLHSAAANLDETGWVKAVAHIRASGCNGPESILFDAALVASSLLSFNTCACVMEPPHRHLVVDFADRLLRGDYERARRR